MTARKTIVPASIAVIVGAALWLATSIAVGKREPWDTSAYWTVTYPLAIAVSALLGYFFSGRPWRWALLLFESQVFGMWIRSGEAGNLWPLSMALLAVISVPGIVAATVASRFGSRSKKEAE
ncbi:hypothetical protein EGT07_08430 [Herbaspirillum sp. HC18]|nr:hypothetical protein EGT07_08430 [Herbaspirillum sp. HC18]